MSDFDRTPGEQRRIALAELEQALDKIKDLTGTLERLGREALRVARELDRAEDNARAGGLSWLSLSDAEIAEELRRGRP